MKHCLTLMICLLTHLALAENVSIIDYQAVADGTTPSATAIQQAIDHCTATGGGTVTVPPGTFLADKTIYLKSNVNLHLQQGAVILGGTNPKAFSAGLIYANKIENAAITGPGTINGQGFKKWFPTNGPRHNNIRLYQSKNITVKDVTLINSPTWVFRILQSDTVIVQGVRIYSFANENNDGIDIDGKNIVISNCIIDCDDDAMCLKSDDPNYLPENISISNCILASNCNAIKFGTAGLCGFKNITVSNCAIRRPSQAAHRRWSTQIEGVTADETVISGIALESVDGGVMDQIAISNISMTDIQTPLFIRLGSRRGPGVLKNVTIGNIVATSESLLPSSITGIPGHYVENVTIHDVIFTYKGAGTLEHAARPVPEKETAYPENRMFGPTLPAYGLYIRHARNLVCENIRFNLRAPDARPAVILEDCHNSRFSGLDLATPSHNQPIFQLTNASNITLTQFHPTDSTPLFLLITDQNSAHIKLIANDFTQVKTIAEFPENTPTSPIIELNNLK